jgi:hypothetical protein
VYYTRIARIELKIFENVLLELLLPLVIAGCTAPGASVA